MVVDILIAYLSQILLLFGPILLFGYLIALCNRRFYANFGNHSMIVCYVTGCIGTPIHELSHALFCLIFGHKIVEIKLFQIGAEDGTLGYVNHTYNRKNIYQRMGNFFIGIAPIVVISAVLFLLAWLLMPSMVTGMATTIRGISTSEGVGTLLSKLFHAVGTFFSYAVTWQWWVFIGLGMFLALHMTLSGADIKGALSGLLFVLLLFLLIDFILGLISGTILDVFTQWVMSVSGYLICFLSVSFLIVLLALFLSFLFLALRRNR